jgi:hypothetical protein
MHAAREMQSVLTLSQREAVSPVARPVARTLAILLPGAWSANTLLHG